MDAFDDNSDALIVNSTVRNQFVSLNKEILIYWPLFQQIIEIHL